MTWLQPGSPRSRLAGTEMGQAPRCPNAFHPTDPEIARDPWDLRRELREHCPVSRVGAADDRVIVVTRYDDTTRVYRDYRSFGNIGFHPSRPFLSFGARTVGPGRDDDRHLRSELSNA